MHKTLADFHNLPESEQEFWIAREMRRRREIRELIKSLKNMQYGDPSALTLALINNL